MTAQKPSATKPTWRIWVEHIWVEGGLDWCVFAALPHLGVWPEMVATYVAHRLPMYCYSGENEDHLVEDEDGEVADNRAYHRACAHAKALAVLNSVPVWDPYNEREIPTDVASV